MFGVHGVQYAKKEAEVVSLLLKGRLRLRLAYTEYGFFDRWLPRDSRHSFDILFLWQLLLPSPQVRSRHSHQQHDIDDRTASSQHTEHANPRRPLKRIEKRNLHNLPPRRVNTDQQLTHHAHLSQHTMTQHTMTSPPTKAEDRTAATEADFVERIRSLNHALNQLRQVYSNDSLLSEAIAHTEAALESQCSSFRNWMRTSHEFQRRQGQQAEAYTAWLDGLRGGG
ncbi:hypothetical protein AC578_5291 [Pseudocercospora eumusae]|uniref:Uncharacterized protein n=1 Tax=Pseudocercospora eumusae TaxID=321146 RepID=A0A139GW70_9PEZI|nr:hypothetical protein AC578_5291 [Pseudocercospora eumusae]